MNIYLSPHHDDVCFSIGHLAASRGGEVVNLFTVSSYVATPSPGAPPGQTRLDTTTERRQREDDRFIQAAGLSAQDFELADVAGDADPFDLSGIESEVDLLTARLIPYLLDRLPADSDPQTANLYCPMGIGAHRNHVSTLMAVKRAYDALSPRCAIFLYEDLHYASIDWIRKRDLYAARTAFAGHGVLPMMVPLSQEDMERKLSWIGFYESQVGAAPQASQYVPFTGMSTRPHEAIWRIFPSQAATPLSAVSPTQGWLAMNGRHQA